MVLLCPRRCSRWTPTAQMCRPGPRSFVHAPGSCWNACPSAARKPCQVCAVCTVHARCAVPGVCHVCHAACQVRVACLGTGLNTCTPCSATPVSRGRSHVPPQQHQHAWQCPTAPIGDGSSASQLRIGALKPGQSVRVMPTTLHQQMQGSGFGVRGSGLHAPHTKTAAMTLASVLSMSPRL